MRTELCYMSVCVQTFRSHWCQLLNCSVCAQNVLFVEKVWLCSQSLGQGLTALTHIFIHLRWGNPHETLCTAHWWKKNTQTDLVSELYLIYLHTKTYLLQALSRPSNRVHLPPYLPLLLIGQNVIEGPRIGTTVSWPRDLNTHCH